MGLIRQIPMFSAHHLKVSLNKRKVGEQKRVMGPLTVFQNHQRANGHVLQEPVCDQPTPLDA